MKRRSARPAWRVIAALVAAGLILALPGVAVAQTDTRSDSGDVATSVTSDVRSDATDVRPDRDRTIAEIKERALKAIARRIETVARLTTKVVSNDHLTAEHRTKLLRDLNDAERGLEELARKIRNAESLEELRELVPMITEDFRIYVLVVPKVHEVIMSHTLVAVAGRFSAKAVHIQELIDRARAAGWEVGPAQKALDEMVRLIAAAEEAAGPVADAVIDLQPEDWPDPAAAKLRAGQASLEKARMALRDAHAAAKKAIEELRKAKPNDRPTDVAATKDTAATDA